MKNPLIGLLLAIFCSACGAGTDLTRLEVPAGAGSGEPHLSRGENSEVVLSWLEPVDEGHRLVFATLIDSGWSKPTAIAQGVRWFVNWADVPSVVPITADRWVAHWLVKGSGNPYAYDIYMAESADAGRHWGAPFKLHHDGTDTEHGFVTTFALADEIGVVWLDGRLMVEGGGTSLRTARISGLGVVQGDRAIDELVCDCCQPDVALADTGPVVVYRDRTTKEIRDISVLRMRDGGWSEPAVVAEDGWQISGCPVNGPAIAAAGEQVVVVWYTAAADRPRVRFARSTDSGVSFSAAVNIDVENPLGRVDVELLASGDALVSWLARTTDGAAELTLRRVSPAGEAGPVRPVLRTALSRPAGFPQILQVDDNLLVVWTDVDVQPSRVRSIMLEINSIPVI